MPIISNFPAGGSGGSGGLTLAAVTNITTLTASGKVYVRWTDPDDLVVAGSTLASWGGTLLVRKAGSAPASRRDGTVVLDSKTRNEYKDTYFCDSGLTDGVQYFYKFFPYTTSSAYTDSDDDVFDATPEPVLLGNVSGISVVNAGNGKLNIKWTDPAATIVQDGVTVATWANTTVVVKAGSYATDPDDAGAAFRQVVTNRNAHTSAPLTATGLTNGTEYFVSIFPITTDNAPNTDPANRGTGTPNRFVVTQAPQQSGSVVYNGSAQTPAWDAGYDSTKMQIEVTGQINSGAYPALAVLHDDFCWDDSLVTGEMENNLSPKPLSWEIQKKGLTVTVTMADKVYNAANITAPDSVVAKDGGTTISDVSFVYTWYEGSSSTPMSGTPKRKGSYRVKASIVSSDLRYSGVSAEVSFQITAKSVTIIGLGAADKVYDGNNTATVNGSATINGLETGDTVSVSAGSAAFADKNVGTNKSVTFSGYSLTGADAANYSMSAQPASVTASITRKEVTVSGITANNKTYDGTATAAMVTTNAVFTGIVSGDTLTASCSGTFNNANVGNGKTVTISSLTIGGASAGNYVLASSGNQATTTANITQATGTMTGVPSSVTLNMETLTYDFTIGGNFDGSYTVASNNTSIATVSLVSGKTYRISHVNQTTGTATITVTPSGGSNYTNPSAQSISVTAQFVDEVLNNNTWAVISSVSAKSEGRNYWEIGDCKQIHLQGTVGTLSLNTDLCVYIIGFNHNSAVEGNGITFGTFKTALTDGKDVCLVDANYNSTNSSGSKWFNLNHWGSSSSPYNTNYGGWKGCDARYDILGSTNKQPSGYGSTPTTSRVGYDPDNYNIVTSPVANTLLAAFPADLRAVMKPMTVWTDNKGNSSTAAANVTTSIDYLPLLAQYEVFADSSNTNTNEASHQAQYEYYSKGNSKVKYKHSDTNSAAGWWGRSPYSNGARTFRIVSASGGISNGDSRYSYGLAPAFRV